MTHFCAHDQATSACTVFSMWGDSEVFMPTEPQQRFAYKMQHGMPLDPTEMDM